MDTTAFGRAGLSGWRTTAADTIAPRVAERSSLSEDQVRAIIGGVFLLLSIIYVARAVKEMIAIAREITD